MKLAQVALTVNDVSQAVPFYRDVLGLKLLFEQPKLAMFDAGSARLMLSGFPRDENNPESVLYYSVDDMQSAWEELTVKGVDIVTEPRMVGKLEGREFHVAVIRDQDRRMVGIMSEVRG
jgi:methylmalonyl-CoA/ethylmalonyl-CoA epimerase